MSASLPPRRLVSVAVTSAVAALGATVALLAQSAGPRPGPRERWELVSATLLDADGDGRLAPGETGWIAVTLHNVGRRDATATPLALEGEGIEIATQPPPLGPVAVGLSRQSDVVEVRRPAEAGGRALLEVRAAGVSVGALVLPVETPDAPSMLVSSEPPPATMGE